jgi:hypothetical protein
MFERYACGDSMKRIAKDRSRDGISSPQPQKGRVARSWAQSSVRHILLNESYRGVVFWQDEQSPFAGNRQVHLLTPTVEHHGFPHRSNAPVKLVRSHKWENCTTCHSHEAPANLNASVVTAMESPTLKHSSIGSHCA